MPPHMPAVDLDTAHYDATRAAYRKLRIRRVATQRDEPLEADDGRIRRDRIPRAAASSRLPEITKDLAEGGGLLLPMLLLVVEGDAPQSCGRQQ